MQQMVELAHQVLHDHWGSKRLIYRSQPVVRVSDNYDALGYPPEGVARNERYSRYLSEGLLLRTQTSSAIPTLLKALALDPPDDLLLVVPGLVYRRDQIDRLHVGEPHHLDLWRLLKGSCGNGDLREMIALMVAALLPGRTWRTLETRHPYTLDGLQIEVEEKGEWVEIGECGIADPGLLARCGIDPTAVGGLAMGLGLDRLLMLRKGIPDIRLLRVSDPRVQQQLLDLEPYRIVSNQPAVIRDLSVALDQETDLETLGDEIRSALGDRSDSLEEIAILSETGWRELPASARERMGISESQKNALLRLVIRHPTETLTREEANTLRDAVYRVIHKGRNSEWAN